MSMSSFEELEYLADFLPEEGEAVVVVRRGGELVCETYDRPAHKAAQATSVVDAQFYGRLVQANEQLRALSALPLWSCAIGALPGCLLIHRIAGIAWTEWYIYAGVLVSVAALCQWWLQQRRSEYFIREIRTMMNWQFRHLRLERFAVLGEIRSRPELKTLLTEMTRCGE